LQSFAEQRRFLIRGLTMTTRREFLWQFGGGLGGLALAQLLAEAGELDDIPRPRPEFNGGLHHPARVRRVVQLFMNGGVSQADTFDYKPTLEKLDGKPFQPGTGEKVEGVTTAPGTVMKSPFEFKQYGGCGRWISSAFPHLAEHVDDMAFLMAVASKTNVHGPASYMMNTGFMLPGFPCLGAWLSYGLGRLTDNLPTFVVLPDGRGLPYNQKGNFTAGFLPVRHQGTVLNAAANPPIPDLAPSPHQNFVTTEADRAGQRLLESINRRHAAERPGDSRLDARIASYELAARMQQHAPEALDVDRESPAVKKLYGLEDAPTADFGRRCLLARRLLERGVRFVQVWNGTGGASGNWDNTRRRSKANPGGRQTGRQAGRRALNRSQRSRSSRRYARDLEHGVRPAAIQSEYGRPRPQRRYVGGVARGRRHPDRRRIREKRRLVLAGRRRKGVLLRHSRHHLAPDGHQPRTPYGAPRRGQPSADRRSR
jgi:hypothetical protein